MQLNVDTGITSVSIQQAEGTKFTLDSKAPRLAGYQKNSLTEKFVTTLLPDSILKRLEVLFAKNEEEAKARYAYLQKLVTLYGSEE